MAQFPAPRRILPFIVILGLVAASITVPAAGQWTSIGPDGGFVEALLIDPETPSTLYAGTDRGLVYKSTDSGASWRLMNTGFPPDLNVLIKEMVIDPVTPQTLYMGTSRGVAKSTDGAHSWTQANEGITATFTTIYGLAIDPSNPSTLYAGGGFPNGVFKSTDAANSWTMVLDGGGLGDLEALAVAPSNSQIVYLGAGQSSLYKSTDAGDTWNLFNTGLDDAFGLAQIAVHPTNPDIVYAAAGGGLFKTTNGGTAWAMLNTPETVITSVVVDPSNSPTVYATSDRVMKSTDSGGTWVEQEDDVFNRFQNLRTMVIDPANPLNLYTGGWGLGSEALFKSPNGGASWAMSYAGLRNINVETIAFDPQNPSTIYTGAGEGRGGIHKSTDGGQTWELKVDPPAYDGFTNVLDIVVDPLNSSNVYVGTLFNGGILWSDDGAETWNAPNVLVQVNELGIHPTNPSTLYAAAQSGVYKSTNQARDWVLLGNGLPDNLNYTGLVVDPAAGETVYAGATPGFGGGSAGIYKTTDGGGTWAERANGFDLVSVTALGIAPGSPSTLYAGGRGGMQKSTDGAGNWMTLDIGIPQFATVLSVAIDPFNSSVVYAATNTDGVLKSVDGGTTWTEFNAGLPHLTIQTVAINPADPKQVLAAPYYYSVFGYESLSPQWLFAAGDPSGIGGLFDGVALSNYSGQNASATLEAIDDSTSGKAGLSEGGDLQSLGANQEIVDLPAGEQFADLRENIFPDILETLPVWIELSSDNPDIASFFQFGSGTLTQLDGGVAIENLAMKFFFGRVFDGPAAFRGLDASTRLTVLNPGDEPVTVDLNYLPPEDGPLGLPRQATREIPARSFLDEKASDLFGASISGGYVAGEVTEGGGVAAFEVVQLGDRPMVLGLNASTGNSSTRSFSAQLASTPDVFTNVNLINTSTGARNLDLTAIRTDGGVEGDPVKVILAAGASFSADASEIFGFGAAAAGIQPQGGQFVGSLEVAADGDGVVGDVLFGDQVEVGFAASLPLQSKPFTEAVFSQFADIPGLFFTGLAFYYPGDIGASPQGGAPDTNITIEVILASGESVGKSALILSAGERIDKSISDLAPDAAGKANGYVLVTSTQPLIAQVVFVALRGGGISLFSAVPPKVIR